MIQLFGSGGIYGRAFDGVAVSEQLFGGFEILHDYKEGTDFTPHIHWMPTTNDAGNVKWFLEYSIKGVGGVFSAPSTLTAVSSAGGIAWTHRMVSFSAISGTGILIHSHFMFRLYRVPADEEDTYTNDAALLSFGVHYQIDTLGSRQIFYK